MPDLLETSVVPGDSQGPRTLLSAPPTCYLRGPMQIYDDAALYLADLPADVSRAAAATHIGHFLAWALSRDLLAARHSDEGAEDLDKVRRGWWSGRDYLHHRCGDRLTSDDLSAEGRAFAAAYYASGQYMAEYETQIVTPGASLFHVRDAPEVGEKVGRMLDARLAAWRARPAVPVQPLTRPSPPIPRPAPVVPEATLSEPPLAPAPEPVQDAASAATEAGPATGSATKGVVPKRKSRWRLLKRQWRELSHGVPADSWPESLRSRRRTRLSYPHGTYVLLAVLSIMALATLVRSCVGA